MDTTHYLFAIKKPLALPCCKLCGKEAKTLCKHGQCEKCKCTYGCWEKKQ